MKFEISQRFYFDAAHTLQREIEAEGSRRIHGHTYEAEISLKGKPDTQNGMIEDLGKLKIAISRTRDELDHRFLDEVQDLGIPTLENLCIFVLKSLRKQGYQPSKVAIWRNASGDRCTLTLD
jgi:6-pyruvoyltetrahydropterin/6-carboxytetrahydropterin synthase